MHSEVDIEIRGLYKPDEFTEFDAPGNFVKKLAIAEVTVPGSASTRAVLFQEGSEAFDLITERLIQKPSQYFDVYISTIREGAPTTVMILPNERSGAMYSAMMALALNFPKAVDAYVSNTGRLPLNRWVSPMHQNSERLAAKALDVFVNVVPLHHLYSVLPDHWLANHRRFKIAERTDLWLGS